MEILHLILYRYQAQDFSGQILAEVSALKAPRPAFAPLFTNQFGVHQNWTNKVCKVCINIKRNIHSLIYHLSLNVLNHIVFTPTEQ